MTATGRTAARRVAHSTTLEVLTRAGFVAYAGIHLLVAGIAVRILRGEPAVEGDHAGAFQLLLDRPGGPALLWIAVVGLAAMMVWQLLEAGLGHRAIHGGMRVVERLVSLARAAVYGVIGWTAARFVTGDRHSSAQEQQGATSTVLNGPGGRALVIAAGLAVVAVSVGFLWYAVTTRFERHLLTGRMSEGVRRVARAVGVLSYVTKGIAYAVVGALLVSAATNYDPQRSRGLDGALRTLAGEPYGWLVLGVVAVGFAAYGFYCLVEARYREV